MTITYSEHKSKPFHLWVEVYGDRDEVIIGEGFDAETLEEIVHIISSTLLEKPLTTSEAAVSTGADLENTE
jgi:hypothetical protein